MKHPAPPGDKALSRRVRQHVIARPQTFFAVTLPGLESFCQSELASLPNPPSRMALDQGGVAFEGRLTTCYQANLMCRTATRILMRIASFQAHHFSALESRTRDIPWELYLPRDAAVDVRVSARQSKLYHREAVAERIRNAVRERLEGALGASNDQGPSAAASPSLWVRLQKDRVTLSLDSSDTPLHKRGLKTQGGPAPLRETLAAAALMLAGYDGQGPLCDPMCGSGTFALEAAMLQKRIPPGWYRPFAFMAWPAFREAHWHYLRTQAAPPAQTGMQPTIFASDRSRTAVEGLKTILSGAGADLGDVIDLGRLDFFDLRASAIGARPGLITINPPYGRRLGKPGTAPRLLGEILHKLTRDFCGWRSLMVLPEERLLDRFPFPVASHRVMHGGRPAWLAMGTVPS